jgi:asparagine synthase (glutamine-hydrolysing)
MSNEDGTLRLVANGEIYNSAELRRGLEAGGHRFSSRSDNEVLLHLYEEEGESFIARLNGMFAFAIWDARRRRLMLGRDRLGIKPLYYTRPGRGILFASEIKALLACPSASGRLCPTGLGQYLAHENTFGARTLFESVRMLRPGHYLSWKSGESEESRYWTPNVAPDRDVDFMECCERYRELVSSSVKRHLMSDVPVASYLSSGLDSTTVAHFAAEHSDRPLGTFTGCFSETGWYDETGGARAVSEAIGSKHQEVRIDAEDLERHFDDFVCSLDEPRMGSGAFPQYMVARTAAARYRVILTGHGGDELFAGYPVFKLAQLRSKSSRSEPSLLKWISGTRLSEWPHLAYFAITALRRGKAPLFLPTLFGGAELEDALLPEARRKLSQADSDEEALQALQGAADDYERMLLTYLLLYLPGLFVVEDKISMAHSLESRTPLCDNELVEAALSWPLSCKLHGGRLKAIPKTAMRGRLPAVLWTLPKRGFPTPLAAWLRGPLRNWVTGRLTGSSSGLNRLFRPDWLRRTLERYLTGWRRRVRPLDEIPTHRIWMLLSLESWFRVFGERYGISFEI